MAAPGGKVALYDCGLVVVCMSCAVPLAQTQSTSTRPEPPRLCSSGTLPSPCPRRVEYTEPTGTCPSPVVATPASRVADGRVRHNRDCGLCVNDGGQWTHGSYV